MVSRRRGISRMLKGNQGVTRRSVQIRLVSSKFVNPRLPAGESRIVLSTSTTNNTRQQDAIAIISQRRRVERAVTPLQSRRCNLVQMPRGNAGAVERLGIGAAEDTWDRRRHRLCGVCSADDDGYCQRRSGLTIPRESPPAMPMQFNVRRRHRATRGLSTSLQNVTSMDPATDPLSSQ